MSLLSYMRGLVRRRPEPEMVTVDIRPFDDLAKAELRVAGAIATNFTAEVTAAALEGSIAKWRNIVDGTGADHGSEDCPLCQVFFNERSSRYATQCAGCPVMMRTGKQYCKGSPYEELADLEDPREHLDNGEDWGDDTEMAADTLIYIAAARVELEFLESLRKVPAKDIIQVALPELPRC